LLSVKSFKHSLGALQFCESIIRLSNACINSGGGRFEHLLQIVTW
jgi:hypothetical protein